MEQNHIPSRGGVPKDQLIWELFWGLGDEERQGHMCQSALKQDTWSKSARDDISQTTADVQQSLFLITRAH